MSLTSAHASVDTGPQGGQGTSRISGFTVSATHFAFGATGDVAAVTFRLSPASARTAQVQVTTNGVWLPCSVSGGAASCSLPAGTSAATLDQLSVLASS